MLYPGHSETDSMASAAATWCQFAAVQTRSCAPKTFHYGVEYSMTTQNKYCQDIGF